MSHMNDMAAQEAAVRYFEFQTGLYADPMFKGDYPESVKRRVPDSILPRISPELKKDLLNSTDIYGVNHYTAMHAPILPQPLTSSVTLRCQMGVVELVNKGVVVMYPLSAVIVKVCYVRGSGVSILTQCA